MNKKFLQTAIILTFVSCIYLFFLAFYNKKISQDVSKHLTTENTQSTPINKVLSIMVISDTHLNQDSFLQLKALVNKEQPQLLVHLGDHTDFGDVSSLFLSKKYLDSLDYPYLTLAGDRDIAQSSTLNNFKQVFSIPNSMTIKDIKVGFLNNPFNYTPFSDSDFAQIITELENVDILLTSQPIFVPKDNFFSYKFMGSLDNLSSLDMNQQKLLQKYNSQSLKIISKIRESKKPIIVISGDHHKSSSFKDPYNPLVSYHIVGALSKNIYLGSKEYSQKALQSPRFSVLEVIKNETKLDFNIKEILIEN